MGVIRTACLPVCLLIISATSNGPCSHPFPFRYIWDRHGRKQPGFEAAPRRRYYWEWDREIGMPRSTTRG
ncbi:hypothetical protein ASPCADRAFT_207954 [Aspergillus carbonarius ITEM 5010]|uniref:Uncharacterized protein n=1 Tax=Aspergillus carbonarius (strain ITEM 5010) TaxID=602072 RepID=A0A1R3RLV1_ASPC5|nr:hypothetical protein ASPCADRAFT_207954 [Aspergillus carbonarius ITEM 5010]